MDCGFSGIIYVSCLLWRNSPQWAMASSFPRFLDRTQRRTTVGRTTLDEWSAPRRDLYLTKHTTLTTDKHPFPWWDSNSQTQQASGRRPTPYTARPLVVVAVLNNQSIAVYFRALHVICVFHVLRGNFCVKYVKEIQCELCHFRYNLGLYTFV